MNTYLAAPSVFVTFSSINQCQRYLFSSLSFQTYGFTPELASARRRSGGTGETKHFTNPFLVFLSQIIFTLFIVLLFCLAFFLSPARLWSSISNTASGEKFHTEVISLFHQSLSHIPSNKTFSASFPSASFFRHFFSRILFLSFIFLGDLF